MHKTYTTVPGPVRNLKVVSDSSNILHVTWDTPTYTNGILTGYYILVTNMIDPMNTVPNMVPPYLHQLTIEHGICKCTICIGHTFQSGLELRSKSFNIIRD